MKQVVNIVRYFTLMLTVSVFLTAQTTVLSFDGMAESFVTGSGGAGNVMLLEDEYGDFVEGEGSMRVEVQLTDMVSWGTWTDISMELGETASLAGYSEMRFKMKILREPVSNARSMQFTCDIFESDGDMFRYPEDIDIFYSVHTTGDDAEWFEVVIPFGNLAVPGWLTNPDGNWDANMTKFALGVHADSTAFWNANPSDTVIFLIDDLHLSNPELVGNVLSMEEDAGSWVTAQAHDQTVITIENSFEFFTEGDGSMMFSVAIDTPFYVWGTWTDIGYAFTDAMSLGDATEMRFDLKVHDLAMRKNMIMTVDIVDTEGELFRWGGDAERPGHYGVFNHIDIGYNEWEQIVIPLADMFTPSWSATINGAIDGIAKFAFGVHARQESNIVGEDTVSAAVKDTVGFYMDNVRLSKPSYNATTAIDDQGGIVPGKYELSQNYPNPFNPVTMIEYSIPMDERVSLSIYNIQGQLVRTLVNESMNAGTHQFYWNGTNSLGKSLGSGIYIYNVTTPSNSISKRMVLLK